MRPRIGLSAVALATFLMMVPVEATAQRTDVLTMNNGDEITGEVKLVARGRLSYKTDDMGTLSVKWDKVARLRTNHIQEVLLSNGRRVFGSLRDAVNEYQLVILGDTIDLIDIVEITPIEATFLQRTSGFLDVGLTYAKANAAITATTGWEANYRGEIWGGGINGSNYYQEQSDADPTRRNNASLSGLRFINGRIAGIVFLDLQQNDELNLDLRTSYGAGVRTRPLLNHHMGIELMGGLLINQEKFSVVDTTSSSGESEAATSIEIMGKFDWDWFQFDSPKFDVDFSVAPFVSVTKLGRFRAETDVRASYEVFSDFNVGLTFKQSFDSDPPAEGLEKADFTVTFTVGWSWS